MVQEQAALAAITEEGDTKDDQENEVKSIEVKIYDLKKSKASHGAVAFLKSQISTARFDEDLVEFADFDAVVLAKKATLPA